MNWIWVKTLKYSQLYQTMLGGYVAILHEDLSKSVQLYYVDFLMHYIQALFLLIDHGFLMLFLLTRQILLTWNGSEPPIPSLF